jgi:hypothetical protein
VFINGINHHVFALTIMNKNKYGFKHKRGTTYAAMAVWGFVQKGLAAAEIIVLISLDVIGAFYAAWWPNILNGLKGYNCPKNLYNIS